MYPTLPFGPISMPTGPLFAIFAVVLTLDIAGRYGRRLSVHPDDIWNAGLIGLAAGLIVARLWNVFQFWHIYSGEPMLIVSLRPGGFAVWPGVAAAVVGGYGYLLRRALDPAKVLAALMVGAAAGSILVGISGYATGTVLGSLSQAPWALPYFGEMRHPVGLYRSLGGLLLVMALWWGADLQRPGRTVLLGVLGFALIRLIGDAYLEGGELLEGLRLSQIVAFVVALVAVALLMRSPTTPAITEPTPVQEAIQNANVEVPDQA